jgi:hypothetical protein
MTIATLIHAPRGSIHPRATPKPTIDTTNINAANQVVRMTSCIPSPRPDQLGRVLALIGGAWILIAQLLAQIVPRECWGRYQSCWPGRCDAFAERE